MRLIFLGTPEMAIPTLERLVADKHEIIAVITQPDKPAGRGNKLHVPPVKELSQRLNLPVYQPTKIRTEEFRGFVSDLKADAAVVVAYGRILPKALLEIPRLGFINNHFSLLPKYRGAAPVNWAIARGESETGVTTMLINEGLDTGDILLQRSTEIGSNETAVELGQRLAVIAAELMSETLVKLERGELVPRQQDEHLATHAPILKREDGLIGWNLPASEISNRVRGFQPFPTAWTTLNGTRLIIWQAGTRDQAEGVDSPGVVSEVHKDYVAVAAGGKSRLLIQEMQLEGKKRLGVRDFLNGVKLQPGDILGA